MTRYQLRLLLLSSTSAALLIIGTFFADWFVIHYGSVGAHVDLREIRVCNPHCISATFAGMRGSYPTFATIAFWTALPLFIVVITQAGSKLLSGTSYPLLVRGGIVLGALAFFTALAAGYVVAPETRGLVGSTFVEVARGWGPLALLGGSLAAIVAVRYATLDELADDADGYRPVKIDRPLGEYRHVRGDATPTPTAPSGSTAGSGERRRASSALHPVVAADARPRTPTGMPAIGASEPRAKSASQAPTEVRAKAPSQAPTSGRTITAQGIEPRTKAPSQAPLAGRTTTAQGVEPRTKAPSQAPLAGRTTTAQGVEPRAKSSSQAPLTDTRTKAPSQAPLTDTRTKAPSQAPSDTRTKAPSEAPLADARTKPPSQPPVLARTTSPSSLGSGPIDVSARLAGAGLVPALDVSVAIRPPLPEPPVVPPDQIPVAPESGLVIRKRTPSAAPLDAAAALAPMMPSVASALGLAHDPLRERVKYAVTSAKISSAGLDASRADGMSKHLRWTDIIGIVARRLPSKTPYDGAHFVDIVSTAGATLRILPSTDLTGHTFASEPTERAREIVNVLAAQALDAKLDSATKVFANGTNKAAQLKDEKTLATHDERLA